MQFRHILRGAAIAFAVVATTGSAQAADPTPAWGLMLSGTNADYYQEAGWIVVFPGLAISLAVFGFNLFGDSLRDWLDPKLKV